MSQQIVTLELRRWIVDQIASGQTRDAVLQAMLASGWSQDVAVGAFEDTLRDAHRSNAPKPMPEPALISGAPSVTAGDRDVAVLISLHNPRIVVFGNLLSADECGELVALARERLARSETVEVGSGGAEVNAARTSEGMFFGCGENAVVQRLEARIATLLNWPVENGEGLQVLRYQPGAEYKPHHDYFDPAHSGTPTILKRGGQRLASLVMYLNTPTRGGATTFPDVALEVMPQRGNGVFFSYDRPHPETRTLHGGAPVLEGEKWVATKWLREERFE